MSATLTGLNVRLDETLGLQDDDTSSALPAAFAARIPAGYLNEAVSSGSVLDLTGITTDIAFAKSSGAPLDGVDSGLTTTDGDPILLWTDSVDNNVLLGKTAADQVVFAAYLEPIGSPISGAKLWTVSYEAVHHPDDTDPDDSVDFALKAYVNVQQVQDFSLANAPAGQNLFMMFGDAADAANPGDEVAIVVTGKNPANQSEGARFNSGDTVNTSLGGGNTTIGTNNQMIDPSEGMYFTFVTNANPDFIAPNLNPIEADQEANIDFGGLYGTTLARFAISQMQPVKAGTVKVSAFTTEMHDRTEFVDHLHDNTQVAIDGVQVYDQSGVKILDLTADGTAAGITVDFSGGSVSVSGVLSKDSIVYHTVSAHSRVLIENAATAGASASFDIGGFSLVKTVATPLEIGSHMLIDDDGPSVATTGTPPALVVDETVLATDASADFSTNFTGAFGADGPGSVAYALGVSAEGVDSGLVDTATNNHVYLRLESGVVVGREGADAAAAASGPIAFTVSVSSAGVVTLDQQRAVVHDDPADPDESTSPAMLAAAAMVTLTGKITDGDGDTATASLNIGDLLKFEDDGPSISTTGTPPTLIVDETVLATDASADFSTNFTGAFGADGPGSVAYALGVSAEGVDSGLVDTATNNHVYLRLESGVVVGREGADAAAAASGPIAFTVSVSSAGVVTLDQQRAVVHDDPTDPDESTSPAMLAAAALITMTGKVTDGDGDTATASLNIGDLLKFEDDGPSVSANAAVQLDDDALTGGNPGGTGDVTPDTANTSGTLAHSLGADGLGSVAYLTSGAPSGFSYEAGAGGSLLVKQGTTTVMTLTLNAATGAYLVTQNAAVMHAAGLDENDQAFTIGYRVTDGDGDTADGSLTVNVDDDTPVAFLPDSLTLSNSGTAVGTEDLNAAGAVGADTPATLAFVDTVVADNYLRDSGNKLLTSGGENIVLSGFGTGTLVGKTETGLATVFTATLDTSGDQYTVDFDRAIDDGGGINFLGSAPVKSGNLVYNVIDNVGGTKLDLLFSGGDTSGGAPADHTVNVSTQGAGTDNQTMNPDETLRIDFVQNAVLAGSPLGSDFTAGAHMDVNAYSFLLTQNNPGGTTGTALVMAFDADDDKTLVGDPDDTGDQITKVMIDGQVLVDGGTVTDRTINGHVVHAAAVGLGWVITGLNEGAPGDGAGGDDPLIEISTADGFNRAEVSNYAGHTVNSVVLGGANFDIAPAGADLLTQGNPAGFELPVQMTDADGDAGPVALIGIQLQPVIV
ncbi:DUF5801 repeats-in-toxin domain-containing protein [Ramlibacter sp.]|uniref:DUF5801 repeats-in-toxin domain-containing protein n=1 Tax=Ramlibacter sp. TaxID=1917967 RepID=UPI002B6D69F3|nr:DUF5801 repeats-in-toxin domain-containing protein [Ramlibacter sp.]HWI82286.1 DUF5801 repeats-in-toxin domain-containing protein [Ramlibacter sp.]